MDLEKLNGEYLKLKQDIKDLFRHIKGQFKI